jgi:aspartate aminotransferase-like enzyme
MINHRGPEFRDLIVPITEKLKRVFFTQNRLYILTASGTGSLEAAVVNTLSPGDRVLAVSVGHFGDRFAELAKAYGADVRKLDFQWGTAADPDAVRRALGEHRDLKAVLVTHNETSTGVTNDLEAIARVVKEESGALLVVDAISSLGCVPLPVDQWRCDVVCTASQKGLMVPPGLSFVSLSEAAWRARETARMPRYYFDLPLAQRYLERGQTPWTPNVPLFYGLEVALNMLLEEGMENVFKRHAHIGALTRQGVRDLGLGLLAPEACASNTVTAVRLPEGVDGARLSELLRTEHSVVAAGGQGRLQGKVLRIGHMGWFTEEEIREVLHALEVTLPKVGFTPARAAAG